MLDRSQAPELKALNKVELRKIETYKNSNNVSIFFDQTEKSGVFKLEIYSRASQLNARNAALCHLSLKILKEGTKKYSAKALAEKIDDLGSFLEITPGFDFSSIAVYGLSRYFKENTELLFEIIYESALLDSSLDKLKSKQIDKLQQNLQKGSYIASTNLREMLFSSNHPYGHKLTEEDLRNTTNADISSFLHSSLFNFDIYLSGDIEPGKLKLLDRFTNHGSQKSLIVRVPSHHSSDEKIMRSNKLVQSSIKVGKRLFTRTHEDYFPFIVTNEILGGYFGSRLMKNIREDKGLTYGIYSQLYALEHDGYFFVSTNVKSNSEQLALEEIYKEIRLMQSTPISSTELSTVKNYMIGTYANSLSTPFSVIEKHKIVKSQKLDLDFYDQYVDNIRKVDTETVLRITNKYLQAATISNILVGP